MKVSKDTKKFVLKLIADSEEIAQNEIIKILQEREKKPLVEELYAKEYSQTANRLVSQATDTNGVRTAFAIRSKKGVPTYYVNLDRSMNKIKVQRIINQLQKQSDGINKSLHKANRKLQVIQGQISFDEYMNCKSVENKFK